MEEHNISDEELLRKAGTGDRRAFDQLFLRYHEPVTRHTRRMTQDLHAAEDLAQETMCRVWTKAGTWSGRGSVKGWIFRIASNLALNHLRSVKRMPLRPLEMENPDQEETFTVYERQLESELPGPEAMLEMTETRERIRNVIDSLPQDKREVLHLVHELGYSIGETSSRLGIPGGTVKSRLFYGRKAIENKLKKHPSD